MLSLRPIQWADPEELSLPEVSSNACPRRYSVYFRHLFSSVPTSTVIKIIKKVSLPCGPILLLKG